MAELAFDPFSPSLREDPYPRYRELRDRAPVHFSPEAGAWCVSRHADVHRVLNAPDVFSSRAMFTTLMNGGHEGRPPLSWGAIKFIAKLVWRTRLDPRTFTTARNLIADDGERHAEMRSIVNRGFTPRGIQAWEPRVRELAEAGVAALRRGEPFDLVEDLAIPLPVTIIAEMLGVEPGRREDFKRWSDSIVEGTTGPGRADRFAARYADTFCELIAYLKGVARQRRAEPADDLISTIVAQQEEGAGLDDREVVQFVILLLVAGNETTTNLLGNAVNALLDHPDQLERLVADPGLLPRAVEEALRFDTPVQLLFRNTTREVELAGVTIPAGATVVPILGSANRDERRFPDPDVFDLDRDPRGHLGFGFGEHFCLGASLARLETRVSLEALLPHLPSLVRSPARARVDSFLVRGLRHLELRPAA